MSKKKEELKTEAQKERDALDKRISGASQDIDKLNARLHELKVRYEQHFLGIEDFSPDKQHKDFQRMIREAKKMPFLGIREKFKIKSIDQKYQTLNNYWERTLKKREEGTYQRDVFKAKIRSGENGAPQKKGQFSTVKEARELFDDFQGRTGDKARQLDRGKFEKYVKDAMTAARKKNPDAKFKVVERNGKIGIVEFID